MEKTLDLKMPGVMELGRKELKELNGGFFALYAELTIIAVQLAIAADEFAEGVKEGWEENKR